MRLLCSCTLLYINYSVAGLINPPELGGGGSTTCPLDRADPSVTPFSGKQKLSKKEKTMYAEIALGILLIAGIWATWYAMTHGDES